MAEFFEQVQEKFNDVVENSGAYFDVASEHVADFGKSSVEYASQAVESMSETAGHLSEHGLEYASDFGEKTVEYASHISENAGAYASHFGEHAGEYAGQFGQHATEAAGVAYESSTEFCSNDLVQFFEIVKDEGYHILILLFYYTVQFWSFVAFIIGRIPIAFTRVSHDILYAHRNFLAKTLPEYFQKLYIPVSIDGIMNLDSGDLFNLLPLITFYTFFLVCILFFLYEVFNMDPAAKWRRAAFQLKKKNDELVRQLAAKSSTTTTVTTTTKKPVPTANKAAPAPKGKHAQKSPAKAQTKAQTLSAKNKH